MTKRRNTVSQAFDSSLQELLRAGTMNVIRLTCPSEDAAIHYRARLNKLRTAMQNENHPDWKLIKAACVKIDRADPKILIVEPQDLAFSKLIHKTLGTEDKVVPITDRTLPAPHPDEEEDQQAMLKKFWQK